MYTKYFEEKVPGKVGECNLRVKSVKSFQGPKAGSISQPILACFACLTLLHYVSKFFEKFSAPHPR